MDYVKTIEAQIERLDGINERLAVSNSAIDVEMVRQNAVAIGNLAAIAKKLDSGL